MSHNQRIVIQNLTYKTTKDQLLFNGLNLVLTNIKTGLIGRNGIGKSTLLKLITNELQPNIGSINVIGNVGYCPQDFSPYYNLTIAQFFEADPKIQALEHILQGSINPNDFTTLADDWNIKKRITKHAEKFSLKIRDLSVKIGSLSDGEITRMCLAKIFNLEPQADFLILDEPTNNLDTTARNTLYNAIQTWPNGIIVISHDQQLLELMDQILALTEHGIKIYGGNFSFYKKQLQIEHAAKQQQFTDAKKSLKITQKSIQTSREKHDRNQAQGRQARQKNDQPKALLDFAKNRSGRTEQTLSKQASRLMATAEQNLQEAKTNLDPDYSIHVALPKTFVPKDKIVATLENVSFRYDTNLPFILHNFNLIIRCPERIAICGPNGSGKTTLVKLIQKIIAPDIGTIKINVTSHYLDQKLEILNQQLSILDNHKILNPKVTENEAHMHFLTPTQNTASHLRQTNYPHILRII
ncbi:MAG: ABC transporter ATP-binding protein, partial [uncultured bacterium]